MESQSQVQDASHKDINVATQEELPTDTVSCISWSPHGNIPQFATSDWDSRIRIYDLDVESQILKQKEYFDTESPCLTVNWHQDMPRLFAGCTDGSIKLFDVETGSSSVVGYHEGPVKSAYWISETNALLTLSFDKTLRFWDPRQDGSKNITGFKLGYSPFCSDFIYPYLAVGMNEDVVLLMNLNHIKTTMRSSIFPCIMSPLAKEQSRSQLSSIKLFCSPAEMRVGFGGNDGRVNISTVLEPSHSLTRIESIITFRGHRKTEDSSNKQTLYPANCMGFHPRMKNFLYTAGGDGKMNFWNLEEKNRIAEFDFHGIPVTRAAMDPSGKYMAYSLGYDWARGIQGYMTQPSKICVHEMQERELKWDSNSRHTFKY